MQEAVLHRPAPFNNDAHEWDRDLTEPAEQPVDVLSGHPGLVPVQQRIVWMIFEADVIGLAPREVHHLRQRGKEPREVVATAGFSPDLGGERRRAGPGGHKFRGEAALAVIVAAGHADQGGFI